MTRKKACYVDRILRVIVAKNPWNFLLFHHCGVLLPPQDYKHELQQSAKLERNCMQALHHFGWNIKMENLSLIQGTIFMRSHVNLSYLFNCLPVQYRNLIFLLASTACIQVSIHWEDSFLSKKSVILTNSGIQFFGYVCA